MMQSKIDKILQQQNNSILQIINAHCSFKKSANQVSEQLSISYDGLDIHIDINFHKKDLQDFLETRLNQRGYERQGYLQELLNNYDDNNESNSNAFLKDLLTGDVLLKNGYDAQNVAVEFLCEKSNRNACFKILLFDLCFYCWVTLHSCNCN